MNVHDSERLAGLLENAGYRRAGTDDQPDVVVFNTCAVRENADDRLYGNLGQLAPSKRANPDLQIAVGGCLAQKDRHTIVQRAPWVDVVFGTHNIGSLPVLLERARVEQAAQVEIKEALETFPSNLPTHRDSAYAAWVSVSVGCNNTCTFCIVPALRGKETDRRPGEILAEIEALVAEGVQEITLLGQNVNAYGVEFGDRAAFAKLLRACGEIEGLERVRFTSPHPKDFTDDVIAAMAETPNVMPQLHMPLQSGSDAVLRGHAPLVPQRALPRASSTGSGRRCPRRPSPPTSSSASRARPSRTSQPPSTSPRPRGSPRPSPSSTRSGPVRRRRRCPIRCPRRSSRNATSGWSPWSASIAWQENLDQVGRTVEVMFADGEGRKDAATHRMSGRAQDNRLVHVRVPEDPAQRPRPGDLADVVITYAAPHHLTADDGLLTLRRTPWRRRLGGSAGPAGRTAGRRTRPARHRCPGTARRGRPARA